MGSAAVRYALSGRQMRAASVAELAGLAPVVTQAASALWWAWIDVWGTLWPTAAATELDPGSGHRPVDVRIYGPAWMPAADAARFASGFSEFIDGIVLLGADPDDERMACRAVLEANCACIWYLYTHEPDLVQSALGPDVECQLLEVGEVEDLGANGDWLVTVTPDGFALERRNP
ncbi:MAG: hypothetical protein HZB16_10290 [Armatimonadetes bacterium]|nr:hypothetical protein [Armatimonadota bacterium]